MTAARTRIARYRPMGSHLWVECFQPRSERIKGFIEDATKEVLRQHGAADLAGFAFVVWGRDGESTCDCANLEGHIPTILIPDFVRNRLLAWRIEGWTLDTINGC